MDLLSSNNTSRCHQKLFVAPWFLKASAVWSDLDINKNMVKFSLQIYFVYSYEKVVSSVGMKLRNLQAVISMDFLSKCSLYFVLEIQKQGYFLNWRH